jgi:hypothetical protein
MWRDEDSRSRAVLVAAGVVLYAGCSVAGPAGAGDVARAQVPTWSQDDLDSFQHGTMSTEVVPEPVLRAFTRQYPDLFPSQDLSNFGLIPDPSFGWPVGFSRRKVAHLGGLSAVGLNCASCHVGEVTPPDGGAPVRVLGMTAHFDAEAYLGAVIVATFRTLDPAHLRRFLVEYLSASDPASTAAGKATLERQWQGEEQKILAAVAKESAAAKGLAPGTLLPIAEGELRLDSARLADGVDLAALARSFVKLFHNMRAALHVPDRPPERTPPASGPGRHDASGRLSAVPLGEPQPFAPAKYGFVWNLAERPWVHWDGNARSPLGRNLHASLGFGAPLVGRHGTERIAPPRYPFAVDSAAAARGAKVYGTHCASCHAGAEGLAGVWARSPYLHNGSVRTMQELLTAPSARAKRFRRGTQIYDAASLGYVDSGTYLLDTTTEGNSNVGHDHGTALPAGQKRDLIEHLKTL